MPYTHPILGVECQTIIEFWHNEAKKENKEVGELMDDFYSQLAEEDERQRQDIISDLPGALARLKEYYDPDYIDITFTPVEVLKISDAVVKNTMRSSSSSFIAKVKCSDNQERWLKYSETHYSGSYMEPPDSDWECVELIDYIEPIAELEP